MKIKNFNITEGNGYCYIGSLLIQYGRAGGGNISFPVKFSKCFVVVTSGNTPGINWTNDHFNLGDTNFGSSHKPGSMAWLAIGI